MEVAPREKLFASLADDTLSEIKFLFFKYLMIVPGAVPVRGVFRSSFLKLLFIPVLFALSTYAVDYTDVQTLRAVLDPVLYKIPGVEGSMIGTCIHGTDEDPFKNARQQQQPVDMCLVYFVNDESLIPSLKKGYQSLNIETSIAVRFEKTKTENSTETPNIKH